MLFVPSSDPKINLRTRFTKLTAVRELREGLPDLFGPESTLELRELAVQDAFAEVSDHAPVTEYELHLAIRCVLFGRQATACLRAANRAGDDWRRAGQCRMQAASMSRTADNAARELERRQAQRRLREKEPRQVLEHFKTHAGLGPMMDDAQDELTGMSFEQALARRILETAHAAAEPTPEVERPEEVATPEAPAAAAAETAPAPEPKYDRAWAKSPANVRVGRPPAPFRRKQTAAERRASERKLKKLRAMWAKEDAAKAKAAEENAALKAEVESLRGRVAAGETLSTELSTLREERDLIRSRVGEMLQQLDALEL